MEMEQKKGGLSDQDDERNQQPQEWVWVILIFVGALIIRLWGIRFGLPYTYHIDEVQYVSGALNLGAGTVGKQPNPTGFINLLFPEYGLFFIFGRITNLFNSLSDFEEYYRTDPSLFYLLGRITSVLSGSLTALIVYFTGKKLFNRSIGIIGAILLAFAYLHVRDSHFAVPDIAMTFWASLTVLVCLLAIQKDSKKLLYLAASIGGVTLATKWSAWMIAAPIGMTTYFLIQRTHPNRVLRSWLRLVLVVGLIFIGSFLVASFEFFLNPSAYLEYAVTELSSGSGGGFAIWQVDTLPGWLFYLKTLSYGLGWLILGFALSGFIGLLVNAIRKRDGILLTWLAFPVLYFIFMGATRHYFARYALPLIPFLAISAAWAVTWLVRRLRFQSRGAVGLALAILTVGMIAQPLISSLRFDTLLTRVDTRSEAKSWIENNLPDGSKIAEDWLFHTPLLSSPNYDLPIPNSKRVYDVVVPGYKGLFRSDGINKYRDEGFDFLITSSFIYQVPFFENEWQDQRAQFYKALDDEYQLIKVFYPNDVQVEPPFIFDEMYGPAISLWQRERPGPVIKIYAVKPPSEP